MRKILSIWMLATASIVLFLTPIETHATVTNLTGYTWVANNPFNPGSFPYGTTANINFTSNGTNFTQLSQGWNPEIMRETLNYGSTEVYNGASWVDDEYKTILITGGNDVEDGYLISTFEGSGTLTPPTPEPQPFGSFESIPEKEWNNSYTFGKLAYNDESDGISLSLDPVANRVFLMSGTSKLLDKDMLDSSDTSELFIISNYTNFKITNSTETLTLSDVNNVAAVYIRNIFNLDDLVTFTIYYWEDNEVESITYEASPALNVDDIKVFFYGTYREHISGPLITEYEVFTDIDFDAFETQFTAFDFALGYSTSDIDFIYHHQPDGDNIGEFDVTISFLDFVGDVHTIESIIRIVDTQAPSVLTENLNLEVSYSTLYNLETWISTLEIDDNYDSDLTIQILNNKYNQNYQKIGTYTFDIKVIDQSGNYSTVTASITVIDDVGPVFSGVSKIKTSIDENITVDKVKSGIAAVDAMNGNVTSTITIEDDELSGNENEPGTYVIVFKAVDLSGNQTLYEVEVDLFENQPGIYIVDDSVIRLFPQATPTVEELLELLEYEDYTDLESTYQPGITGTYQLAFKIGEDDYEYSIIVLGAGQPGIPIPIIEKVGNHIASWTIPVVLGLLALGLIIPLFKKK